MSEDLQSLLEKINREGVEKARAESAAGIFLTCNFVLFHINNLQGFLLAV